MTITLSNITKLSTISDGRLGSLSGAVLSRANSAQAWCANAYFNQAGVERRIYRINIADGSIVGWTRMGPENVDFQDITMAEMGGVYYVAVGDIGDRAGRTTYAVRLYEEKAFLAADGGEVNGYVDSFVYQDATLRSAQGIAWDPISRRFAVLTTNTTTYDPGLYELDARQPGGGWIATAHALEVVASSYPRGMAISEDGQVMVFSTPKSTANTELHFYERDSVGGFTRRTSVINLAFLDNPACVFFSADGGTVYWIGGAPGSRSVMQATVTRS